MIPDSGSVWRNRGRGPEDAHAVAILLVASLLAAGTALSQFGRGGSPFPSPPAAQMADRSTQKAGRPVAVPPSPQEVKEPLLPGPLNVNTADVATLQALPGIGPALAERIVADREARGLFRTPEDLLRVPGIGPKRWERIRPLVRLAEES
jgi:competence ComEA-like helix-hairpin-helix protein